MREPLGGGAWIVCQTDRRADCNAACAGGCGNDPDTFNNLTSVSSHELIEAVTDPGVGLATSYAAPLAWYDPAGGEISDICNAQQAKVAGWTIQKNWSNALNKCVTIGNLPSGFNLGVTPTRRYLRETVTEAQGKPASQSVVKRLNFCIWTEGTARWLDAQRFAELVDVDGPSPLPSGRGFGGLDLSSTIDLSAFAGIVPRETCPEPGHSGRCYDLRSLYWFPEENLRQRVKSDGVPYDELASVLSLNPASIGTLLSRARAAFRKEYVRRYGEHA